MFFSFTYFSFNSSNYCAFVISSILIFSFAPLDVQLHWSVRYDLSLLMDLAKAGALPLVACRLTLVLTVIL